MWYLECRRRPLHNALWKCPLQSLEYEWTPWNDNSRQIHFERRCLLGSERSFERHAWERPCKKIECWVDSIIKVVWWCWPRAWYIQSGGKAFYCKGIHIQPNLTQSLIRWWKASCRLLYRSCNHFSIRSPKCFNQINHSRPFQLYVKQYRVSLNYH